MVPTLMLTATAAPSAGVTGNGPGGQQWVIILCFLTFRKKSPFQKMTEAYASDL